MGDQEIRVRGWTNSGFLQLSKVDRLVLFDKP